jgi:endonuclease/exonuclease/phosphatase family metal-dependent hydrolase
MWIGRGNLDNLLKRLAAYGVEDPLKAKPFILLVQEAYRSDPFVPHKPKSKAYGFKLPKAQREDIVEIAKRYQLSLRYMPSMRNGESNSDRGNAILSNVALGSTWSVTLPYVRRSRVVTAVEVLGLPSLVFASAHLDVWGNDPTLKTKVHKFGAGRVLQAKELIEELEAHCGESLFIGGDFNTSLGVKDPVTKLFLDYGYKNDDSKTYKHTAHGLMRRVRFHLDHIFYKSPLIDSVEVIRIDEDDEDTTRYIFGSDHHPFLIRIRLKS